MKETKPESSDVPEVVSHEAVGNRCCTLPNHTSPSRSGFNVKTFLKRHAFVILTMAAVFIGGGLGFALRGSEMTDREILYLSFPGELLMRVLQMSVLPLIISSLISGISSVNRNSYGRTGLKALIFYMVTTVIAASTGILLAVLLQPGISSKLDPLPSSGNPEVVQTANSFLDLIRFVTKQERERLSVIRDVIITLISISVLNRNMIPSNLVEACFRKYKTFYSGRKSAWRNLDIMNVTGMSNNVTGSVTPLPVVNDREAVPGTSDGINLLGLLVFCIVFGLVLGKMGPEGKLLKDFFECLNKAIMCLVSIVIWYSPVGTLFLVAGQIVKMTDPGQIGREVAMYTLTVVVGLLIHSLITLPLIYFLIKKKTPFRFVGGLLEALSTAFVTSSSSATLPVTLKCMEQNHNMNKQVTRLMLPLGATMNMDGAALYEAVAALFIAQVNHIDFNLGQIIVLSLIVTAASTGAAGIPQAGMVSMVIVLTSVGLPVEGISLLLIVDWLLDRLRTVTNVLGDCIGVAVVQHLSRHSLDAFEL